MRLVETSRGGKRGARRPTPNEYPEATAVLVAWIHPARAHTLTIGLEQPLLMDHGKGRKNIFQEYTGTYRWKHSLSSKQIDSNNENLKDISRICRKPSEKQKKIGYQVNSSQFNPVEFHSLEYQICVVDWRSARATDQQLHLGGNQSRQHQV